MLYNKVEFSVFSDDLLQDLFDAWNYAASNGELEKSHDELERYALSVKDDITGYLNGSYACNTLASKENVLSYFGIFQDAVKYYDISESEVGEFFLDEDWELMDVICREYLFDMYLDEYIDEYLTDIDDEEI